MSFQNRIFCILFILSLHGEDLFSQYRICTLQCDSGLIACDTLSIEQYDAEERLIMKERRDAPFPVIVCTYDERGQLIIKQHRTRDGITGKTNKITYDSNGVWMTDSLLDTDGRTLLILKKSKLNESNRFRIDWFFNDDTASGAYQIIQEDDSGLELSNTTCYAHESCITYRFFYNKGRKVRQEIWVLDEARGLPLLRETEEFYYGNNDELPSGSVRFVEPEHRSTAHFRYVRISD